MNAENLWTQSIKIRIIWKAIVFRIELEAFPANLFVIWRIRNKQIKDNVAV
jgi:hypothetical protein